MYLHLLCCWKENRPKTEGLNVEVQPPTPTTPKPRKYKIIHLRYESPSKFSFCGCQAFSSCSWAKLCFDSDLAMGANLRLINSTYHLFKIFLRFFICFNPRFVLLELRQIWNIFLSIIQRFISPKQKIGLASCKDRKNVKWLFGIAEVKNTKIQGNFKRIRIFSYYLECQLPYRTHPVYLGEESESGRKNI